MTGRKVLCSIMLVLSAIFMNACATTELTSVWKNEAYQGGPLRKILIIGVDRNQGMKRLLENEFVLQLKANGIDAVPGHTVLPEDTILEKEMITAKISELRIDSVLITTLVDVKETEAYESPTFFAPTGFYGYYMQCCYNVMSGYNVEIETRIFDARYDTLIWSALSDTVLEPAPEETIKSYITAIVSELQNEKLLHK
jgi:hypothetical protein